MHMNLNILKISFLLVCETYGNIFLSLEGCVKMCGGSAVKESGRKKGTKGKKQKESKKEKQGKKRGRKYGRGRG